MATSPSGGDASVSVQWMTNTKTEDVDATVGQIRSLERIRCDMVRVAVSGKAAVAALPDILAQAEIPVVADIHFDYRLGFGAVAAGVHALRINPGNIGARERVKTLVGAWKETGIPIRVGANSASLEKDILERGGHPTAQGTVESAMRHVELLDGLGFEDVALSLKASDVAMTVEANRLMAEKCDLTLNCG